MPIFTLLCLVGCSCSKNDGSVDIPNNENANNEEVNISIGNDYDFNKEVIIENPEDIIVPEITNEFLIETTDGVFLKTKVFIR